MRECINKIDKQEATVKHECMTIENGLVYNLIIVKPKVCQKCEVKRPLVETHVVPLLR